MQASHLSGSALLMSADDVVFLSTARRSCSAMSSLPGRKNNNKPNSAGMVAVVGNTEFRAAACPAYNRTCRAEGSA